jgi:hypothetical protein
MARVYHENDYENFSLLLFDGLPDDIITVLFQVYVRKYHGSGELSDTRKRLKALAKKQFNEIRVKYLQNTGYIS